jgi:hypothetical protein
MDSEARAKVSTTMKKLWSNPKWRAEVTAKIKKAVRKAPVRQRSNQLNEMRAGRNRAWADPARRAFIMRQIANGMLASADRAEKDLRSSQRGRRPAAGARKIAGRRSQELRN